jgi:hypothetical protein
MDSRTKHLSIKARNATSSAMASALASVSELKKRSFSLIEGEDNRASVVDTAKDIVPTEEETDSISTGIQNLSSKSVLIF